MPKMQNELIIYLNDQLMYWFTLEEEKYKLLKKISMPSSIYKNGDILDETHLHYLIKKQLDELKKTPTTIDLIVSSDMMISRSLKTPKLSNEEEKQLIENELPQLFIQDLSEYTWTKTELRDLEEERQLLLTITPTNQLEKFYSLFDKLGVKKINIYPESNLLMYFLEIVGGGAIFEHNLSSYGYHYLNGDQVYTKYFRSESFERLYREYPMDFESVSNLLKNKSDEVTVEIDAETFKMDFYDGLYADRHAIENLSDSFPAVQNHFKFGTLFDDALIDYTDPILDETGKTLIETDEISKLLYEHQGAVLGYTNASGTGHIKHKLLKIAALVSVLLLVGSYLIGKQLESQVDEYAATRSHVEERNLDLDDSVDQSVIDVNDEYQDQYPEIINQIFLTKPEDAVITSIFIEDGISEVNGQVNAEDALNSWMAEIEKITGQDASVDSSAVIDGVIYFKFTIGSAEDNYV